MGKSVLMWGSWWAWLLFTEQEAYVLQESQCAVVSSKQGFNASFQTCPGFGHAYFYHI